MIFFCRRSESRRRKPDMLGVWDDQGEWQMGHGWIGDHEVCGYTSQRSGVVNLSKLVYKPL